MSRFYADTAEQVVAYLERNGYAYNGEYERYERGSWYAYIVKGRGRFANRWTYTAS